MMPYGIICAEVRIDIHVIAQQFMDNWRTYDMSISLIFKIAAVGILVTVLSQVLKHSGREEHAFLTSLAGLLIVLFWIVPYVYELFETMRNLFAL